MRNNQMLIVLHSMISFHFSLDGFINQTDKPDPDQKIKLTNIRKKIDREQIRLLS